jgi:hypothetical protein
MCGELFCDECTARTVQSQRVCAECFEAHTLALSRRDNTSAQNAATAADATGSTHATAAATGAVAANGLRSPYHPLLHDPPAGSSPALLPPSTAADSSALIDTTGATPNGEGLLRSEIVAAIATLRDAPIPMTRPPPPGSAAASAAAGDSEWRLRDLDLKVRGLESLLRDRRSSVLIIALVLVRTPPNSALRSPPAGVCVCALRPVSLTMCCPRVLLCAR